MRWLAFCGVLVIGCSHKPEVAEGPAANRVVTVPMGATSALGPSAATPVVTTGPAPEIPDEPTQKLQDAVGSARGALKRCYEEALVDDPYLRVDAEITVHIDDRGRGVVKKVQGPLPESMRRCVTNVLTGIAYPPNFATDVNVPLSFKSTTL